MSWDLFKESKISLLGLLHSFLRNCKATGDMESRKKRQGA